MTPTFILKKILARTPNRRGENDGDLKIQVLLGCYAVLANCDALKDRSAFVFRASEPVADHKNASLR